MKKRQSEDEGLLLKELREAGFDVKSVVHWLVSRPETYAGAEELLLRHLETCRDDRLAGLLAALLGRRKWRPALPALIAQLRRVQSGVVELRIAQVMVKLGLDGHEEEVSAALSQVRTVATQRRLRRALRKAGWEPPLTGYMATEERILGGSFAAALAIVGGLALGLAPLIVERAGWLVLPPEIAAGVASIVLAVAVWRRSRRMITIYPWWAVATVAFHIAYQAGAHLFSWKLFLFLELGGVIVLWLVWRFLVQDVLRKV